MFIQLAQSYSKVTCDRLSFELLCVANTKQMVIVCILYSTELIATITLLTESCTVDRVNFVLISCCEIVI